MRNGVQRGIKAQRWLWIILIVTVASAAPQDILETQMTIYRDEFGVPHIVGETEEAAFFGYGYAQAEDHLERMMIQYRDAQGRRTEIDGIAALGDGYLQFIPYEYRWGGDYLQRLLRTKKGVVENRAKIDPQLYRILDAFARGVNAYIREHRLTIPAWIDEVSAEDIEALERSHYFRFYSAHDALSKISDRTWSFPNLGSNQWAIAPAKSANGRIIHVEHTHMPWANRFQNYEAHLITPGKLNAGGISWFGSPFFLDGFNDRITWSATWNEPNIADVYIERINPANPLQYFYEGQWRDIRIEYEIFRIKGPKGLESVTLPLYYTHHGPIVRFDPKRHQAHSIKLPNYDGVNYSAGMYELMRAGNLAEFKSALARQLIPRWNFLYTDAHNIYWVHNGNVAERAPGVNWSKPVPGWTKATEWGPYIGFQRYPQILNPPAGFLQNCNNPPWVATRNSGLKPLEPVPYWLRNPPRADAGEEALNTRGERIFNVLSGDRKFTVEDMIELGFDTHIAAADVIVPLLTRAWDAVRKTREPELARAVALFGGWDRRSAGTSTAYTLIHFWGKAYQRLHSSARFARFNSYG
ncbi:MAG TPA: penicillin acylase family protein, partial [Bryobacteraceae bacterium]|nr:penicillin acylase family protein [Bryobacteraceae bacterium]